MLSTSLKKISRKVVLGWKISRHETLHSLQIVRVEELHAVTSKWPCAKHLTFPNMSGAEIYIPIKIVYVTLFYVRFPDISLFPKP
jgi:hypothetical protein